MWGSFLLPMHSPYLGTDKTYDEQRKDRLQNVIDDYLQDDKINSRKIYEDIISCIEDVANHHRTHLDRAEGLKMLMLGRKDLDLYDRIILNEEQALDKI